MRGLAAILAISIALAVAGTTSAEDTKPFAEAAQVNLAVILPPPPAQDSLRTKIELGEILTIQVTRTPAMEARAIADDKDGVWSFSDVVDNPKYTKENLPKFSAFMDRIAVTANDLSEVAKKMWSRPRPYILSELVQPIVPRSNSGSYPSGHTTIGTLMGIALSNMLPEKREAIMRRAWEFGQSRVIAGMHYPSDVEAGRIAGSVIAQSIMYHEDYQTDFAAARTELRSHLGLPQLSP